MDTNLNTFQSTRQTDFIHYFVLIFVRRLKIRGKNFFMLFKKLFGGKPKTESALIEQEELIDPRTLGLARRGGVDIRRSISEVQREKLWKLSSLMFPSVHSFWLFSFYFYDVCIRLSERDAGAYQFPLTTKTSTFIAAVVASSVLKTRLNQPILSTRIEYSISNKECVLADAGGTR